MWEILKWFLAVFFGMFLLWVLTGGPERGTGDTPFVNAPTNVR